MCGVTGKTLRKGSHGNKDLPVTILDFLLKSTLQETLRKKQLILKSSHFYHPVSFLICHLGEYAQSPWAHMDIPEMDIIILTDIFQDCYLR